MVTTALVVSAVNFGYWIAATRAGALGPVLPTPPLTAGSLLLLAANLAGVLMFPRARWPRRGLLPVAFFASGVMLVRALPGLEDWESVFDPARLHFLGLPAGRSRYAAAALVAVTSINLAACLLPTSFSRWWKIGTGGAAVCALTAFLTLVADTGGNPIFAGGGLLGVPPFAALVTLLLNAALVTTSPGLRQMRRWFLGHESPTDAPLLAGRRLAIQSLVLLTVIAVVSVSYLRIQTRVQYARVAADLKADVELKAAQITKWRQERVGDARTVHVAPWYRETVTTLVTTGLSPEQTAEMREVTATFARNYGYRRLTVFDSAMLPLYSYPAAGEFPAELKPALQPGQTTPLRELPVHLDRDGTLLWGHLVRIRKRYSDDTAGYVLLQKDLRELFSYLEAWPKDNQSGQTILWRRLEDRMVSLGGLRDIPETSAGARVPFALVYDLRNPSPNIAQAARGEPEATEGPTPAGHPLVGIGRLVPDSDWLVTSSMRSWEVYAPLRRLSWMVFGFSSAALAAVGYVATRFWRDRQRQLASARILAELERKRSVDRLGLVLQEARDIILIVDSELRVIEANRAATAAFGWSREELLAKGVADLRAPDSRHEVAEVVRELQSAGSAFFETTYRRRNGTTFPAEASIRRVHVDGQKQSVAIIRDISERKRAEADLRASEERYRLIAENTSDVIWLVDLSDYRFKYVSPSTTRATGWLPQEIIGQPLGEFSTASSGVRAKVEHQVAAYNGGDGAARSQIHEMELVHKDGTLRHVEILATLLPGPDGRAAMLLGVNRDITERRLAEEALRASEERYRLIAENTSDVIWLYDQGQDAFTYVSPSVTAQLGHRPEDLVGRTLLTTLSPASAQRAAAILADLAARPDSGHAVAELDHVHRDGHLVPSEIVASVLRDESGKITHVLGVTRDITARRRAEVEHREAREVAASLERERKLSEMKSQFISVASHEFRTPLAAATATLELIERHGAKLAEAKQAELRRRIQVSLGRLTTIMNDVLQLSRADSGRVKVHRQEADLRLFLADIVDEVAAGDANKHALEFIAPTGARTVAFDSRLLHHVVSNLLGNAVRYSPAGTRITLATELRDQEFAITVRDEGIGIPAAERDRIFEPFARGSNVGAIGGTGLGLNIVKRYTELMGGQIELLPSERGAVFRVTIPHPAKPS